MVALVASRLLLGALLALHVCAGAAVAPNATTITTTGATTETTTTKSTTTDTTATTTTITTTDTTANTTTSTTTDTAATTTTSTTTDTTATTDTTVTNTATTTTTSTATDTTTTTSCTSDQSFIFPAPRVSAAKRNLTREQKWMEATWPGYNNGVSLGGSFVIEDWMFFRDDGVKADHAKLRLAKGTRTDNHAWSQALLEGDQGTAFATMDCHLRNFYSDKELDQFAEFGINTVRLPVGYWLFDDPTLYPNDTWVVEPKNDTAYGVNPDGFITPGTVALTDFVVRLWNRNMKVLLDMHAPPGCASPHQSYAGIYCEPIAPNTWNGEAHDGISGGTKVQRADDGKTWTEVYHKIALERVVPWIKHMEKYAPGAIIGYELVSQPDMSSADATAEEVKAVSLDLGKEVLKCLGSDLTKQVRIGVSTAGNNYHADDVAAAYKTESFSGLKTNYINDIHHYFAWSGCIDYGAKTFSIQCACEANLPGTAQASEDLDWSTWMKSGVFDAGWRFYIGEWSAGLGTAHNCQYGLPTKSQSASLWEAQKWDYLMQYVHYKGKSDQGQSSFLGDFYWNGRMGYNWNPDPKVCSLDSSATHYENFEHWDWSLLRLIKLGLAKPLSELGFTPTTIAGNKSSTCTGTIPVLCDAPIAKPAAPPGGQTGMDTADTPAAPPGGQPDMDTAETPAAPPGGQPGMDTGKQCAKMGQSCAPSNCCVDPSLSCMQVNVWYKGCVALEEVVMKKDEESGASIDTPLSTSRTAAAAFGGLALVALIAGASLVVRRRRASGRGRSDMADFELLVEELDA